MKIPLILLFFLLFGICNAVVDIVAVTKIVFTIKDVYVYSKNVHASSKESGNFSEFLENIDPTIRGQKRIGSRFYFS